MNFRKVKKKERNSVTVQTSRSSKMPFSLCDSSVSFGNPSFAVFDAIRENIPIIDAAINKIIRLVGTFSVSCSDKKAQTLINDFLKTVPTGVASGGINSFISAYLDSLIMYGAAVGEIVVGSNSKTVRGLLSADIRDIEFKNTANPFHSEILVRDEKGRMVKAPHPELLLLSSSHANSNFPYGKSMLEGLPFVSGILLKIYQTIGSNWERAGNIRYALTYKPDSDFDGTFPSDRADEIAKEWAMANSDDGTVKDFVAIGDVNIKAIGADSPILDSDIPVRQMLKQIVAKTGLPPFLLGLSWSSTERMSSQQADMLTSELEYYREVINPVLIKICDEFLRREGFNCSYSIDWADISLQDMTELSRARLYDAQAKQIESKGDLE